MVRRHVRSEFAADVFVFPGGKVDAADADPRVERYVRDQSGPEVAVGGDRQTWLALKIAAIRELFEETGVLLAGREAQGLIRLDGSERTAFAQHRLRVQTGELSMLDLARLERLRFAADRLHPFSRWITPEILPRRYDTRFFVAYAPPDQDPMHDAVETTESVWIAPAEALASHQRGDFPLVFPTRKHLERMAHYPSIEPMLAATSASDLEPVMPCIVERGEETVFLMPGDEGY